MLCYSSHLTSMLIFRRYFQEHRPVARIRIAAMNLFAVLPVISVSVLGFIPFLFVSHKLDLLYPPIRTVAIHKTLDRSLVILLIPYPVIACWAALSCVLSNRGIIL